MKKEILVNARKSAIVQMARDTLPDFLRICQMRNAVFLAKQKIFSYLHVVHALGLDPLQHLAGCFLALLLAQALESEKRPIKNLLQQ